VNEDVIAHLRRHEYQPEVQRNAAAGGTRSPPRSLAADRCASNAHPMRRSKIEQSRRKLTRGLRAQRAFVTGRPSRVEHPCPLAPCPVKMSVRETPRLGTRTAPGNCHAKIAVRPHPHDVAAGPAHADVVDLKRLFDNRLVKWKADLHVTSRDTSSASRRRSHATACCSGP
jgi:hypothetical protein